MKKSLLIPIAFIALFTPSAHADIWGDIGHAIEDAGSRLGRAAGDVITAGEEGRNRDREAANEAKRRAEDQQRAAEKLRAERIQGLRNDNARLSEVKTVLSAYSQMLGSLKSRFSSSMQMTQQLASIISQKSLEDQAVQSIIEIQKKDITEWIASLDRQYQDSASRQDEALMKVSSALKEKVIQYFDQISNLPRDPAQNVESSLDAVLDLGFETMQAIDQVVSSIDKKISEVEASIQSNNQQMQSL